MVEEPKAPHSEQASCRPRRARKQKFVQVLVGLIIFISGMFVGVGGTIAVLKDKVIWMHRRPRMDAGKIVEYMKEEYRLTDQQVPQIKQLMDKHFESGRIVRQEFQKRMETGIEQFTADMKQVLTPQQFEQWKQDFQERRKQGGGKFRPRPPGPSGPSGPSEGHHPKGPPPDMPMPEKKGAGVHTHNPLHR